jgi:P27 family predicted phage terminase small subunit
MPTPPDFLSVEALAEWHDKCPLLFASGLVTVTNRAVFAAYCMCFARWKSAEEALAEMARDDQTGMGGLTVRNASTGKTIENPMISIANRAMADCVKFAAELGMTPSSRSRVHHADLPRDDDPAGKYLT